MFLYDGDNVVADYTGGALAALYVTPFLDQNLSLTKNGAIYYYSHDGLGSVRTLSDLSGAAVNRYDYTAWGEPLAPTTRAAVAQRYTFTGRERNPASPMMYYRYRQYSSAHGCFTSRDFIGYYDGIVLYVYASQRPMMLVDPLGAQEQCCCCCVTFMTLSNVRRIAVREPHPVLGEVLEIGHHFEVHISLQYKKWDRGFADCILEWDEKSNCIPKYLRERGAVQNKWYDVVKIYEKSPTVRGWTDPNRSKPCPGTPPPINLEDEPLWPYSPYLNRYLKFRIVVRSAAECDCPIRSVTIEAEQRLKAGNTATGIADDGWEFTYGAPYQDLPREEPRPTGP